MEYRQLGRTGLKVSEISFGAWAIGKTWWGEQDDNISLSALHRALDMGVNFIDTAQVYGDGHSEQLIAKVLKERNEKNKITVATKVPPKNVQWPGNGNVPLAKAFPKDYVISRAELSLKALATDCLDIYQLHVWSDGWIEQTEWYEGMQKLKEQGKIRFIGASINDHAPDDALKLVESGMADTIQVIYNLFDQSPEDKLLPLAKEKNVGIIARVPFDEGSLTGKFTYDTKFSVDDFRARYFRGSRLKETVDRAEKLKFLVRGEIKSLAQASLKFCLSHPGVSTVIPGIRTPEQAELNCAASDGKLLTPEELKEIKKHRWVRNFYS